jgi:hypothetical protein
MCATHRCSRANFRPSHSGCAPVPQFLVISHISSIIPERHTSGNSPVLCFLADLGIECRISQIVLYIVVRLYCEKLLETKKKMDTPLSSARGDVVYLEFHH